ncbi:MAG: Rho termination factor N-terminal domain-containing protein [Candidatus Lokiarchaeota archaeon]|nr:Rho termination factor N-terminal domain-containing protein [Candidatus Lokiarchaeota archaeon]
MSNIRKIDERTYLSYIIQSYNIEKLKNICKEFGIKGYSKFKKKELIDYLLDSLSEEEISSFIKEKELDIISDGIQSAIGKIKGTDRESIKNIKIVNPNNHEVEFVFKGMNWETKSFLSITTDNMGNPERDCDCRIGAEMGFCGHFWVGFIFSLKQDYFKLSDWNLTGLPDNFDKIIKNIKISAPDSNTPIKLIDESSDGSTFLNLEGKSITIYEGEIDKIEQKEQVFQENITIYYLISLTSVKIGPRLQKKSDYKEGDIIEADELAIRISKKLREENDLKIGDKLTVNGIFTRDNFLRLNIVKNIRKIVVI